MTWINEPRGEALHAVTMQSITEAPRYGQPAAFIGRPGKRMVENRSSEVAVVDDDPEVLESFRFILELAGFEVGTYPSAIAYLARTGGRPRCLILDHHMPVMTGLDLARTLRDDGIDTPVLLITAAPSPAISARAAEIGIVRVLEKPPCEEDLIDFVTGAT